MREFVNNPDVRKDAALAPLLTQFSQRRDYNDTRNESSDREFMRFLDRQRSKSE